MKKRVFLLAVILLTLLGSLLFFPIQDRIAPQLSEIKPGMSHRDILRQLPGIAHPEYRLQEDRPMIYRSGGQLALVIYEQDLVAGCFIFDRHRRQLEAQPCFRGFFSQSFPAAMAQEDLSAVTLYELQDKYGFDNLSPHSALYEQHFLLDNGCILTLQGEKVHKTVDHDPYTRDQLPVDEKGRSPWYDVVFTSATLFDPYYFQPGMYWYQIPYRATRVLLAYEYADHTQRARAHILHAYEQHGIKAPLTEP